MSTQQCPHCHHYDNGLDRGYCIHCGEDLANHPVGITPSPKPSAASAVAPRPPLAPTAPANAARFRVTAVGIDLIRTGFGMVVPATVLMRLGDWPLTVPRFVTRLHEWALTVPLILASLCILGGLVCCCWCPSRRTLLSALFRLIFIPAVGVLYVLFPETMTAYRAAEAVLSLVPLGAFALLAEGVITCSPQADAVRKKFERRVSVVACCYGLSFLFAIGDGTKQMNLLVPIARAALPLGAAMLAFVAFLWMLGLACDMWSRLAHPAAPSASRARAEGAASPRRWPILGVVLMVFGWALFVPATIVLVAASGPLMAGEAGPLGLAVVVVVGVCWWAGGACVVLGRRMRSRRADVALRDDPRPPILYLRSFQFDGSETPQGPPWQIKSTYEVHLTRALGKFGPVVAIGQPGEALPELGAARLYVDDDHWQQEVRGLMARAGVVVLTAGESQGLQWELHEAVSTVAPERLLLFLPYGPSPSGNEDDRLEAEDARQETYDRFRSWARHVLPKGLPARVGAAHFIYFAADWTPHLLVPPEVPFLLGFRRLRVEMHNQILQPLLEGLQQDKLFLRPLRMSFLVPMVAAAAIVGSVFYLVLEKNVSYFVAMPAATIVIVGLLIGIMAVLKKL